MGEADAEEKNGRNGLAAVARRLECHKAEPMRGLSLRLVAGGMVLASTGLMAAIWML